MNRPSDADLVSALASGDEAALGALVDRYARSVYRFCLRYCNDPNLAEDASQEVFLRIFLYARKFRPDTPFKTWMFAIARNASADALRSAARARPSGDGADSEGNSLCPNPTQLGEQSDPEKRLLTFEESLRVNNAIADLPDGQRAAVILRYFEEMQVSEIAGVLGRSVSSVESLLVRAKRNLAKSLSE